MVDNLGGRLGSFDRLEQEFAPGSAGRRSTARWAGARSSETASGPPLTPAQAPQAPQSREAA